MRQLAVALALLAGTGEVAAEPALAFMHGTWRDEQHVLLIDTDRMQANTDPAKPFQRDALTFRNLAGRMVVFDIGSRRYIGLFEGNEMQLSGGELEGVVKLRRVMGPRLKGPF